MKNAGCTLLIALAVLVAAVTLAVQSPIGITLLAGTVAGAIAWRISKRHYLKKYLIEGLELQAKVMDSLAKDDLPDFTHTLALNAKEQVLYVLPLVSLTEYQSTGSTYSGTNVGLSIPVGGNLRANVGGHTGQITKNPEQLMIVDQGQAIFTNQRIVFIGAKEVRDWDLSKTVSLDSAPNATSVKIAVTNHDRISGLQAVGYQGFGPGFVAAYAFNWSQQGAAAARKWAKETAEDIRSALAAEAAKNAKPNPPELEQPK
ncbi:MAG: hypothetical protein ACKOOE_04135 [Micrococcales bacterium]